MTPAQTDTMEPAPEVRTPAATEPKAEHPPHTPRGPLRKLVAVAVVVALVGGLGLLAREHPAEARRIYESVAGKPAERVVARPEADAKAAPPWDGTITLDPKARDAMGFALAEVRPQEEPIKLELLGTTDYITDTLTRIRPMFKSRVDKVHVSIGQAVHKGDPLIDLYSKDLAEAKSLYETDRIQWLHDKWLLEAREPLVATKAITQMVFEETRNTESKSRKECEVSRDKLLVYGLTDPEIDKVPDEAGSQKARMTLRASTDGFVIDRDVVPGNLYDENDNLLVIAPLQQLWVWGNVFESDLNLVKVGQAWDVRFPFLENKLRGKVEYVSNRVDPNTHAVRVRTTIDNPEGRIKADMLVRGMLSIPPIPGRTVIPRTALVVDDGRYYAYVNRADAPDKFERRVVGVAQEKDDHAVIDHGLKPGEKVVSTGCLLLDQMFEDHRTTSTGAPESDGPNVD